MKQVWYTATSLSRLVYGLLLSLMVISGSVRAAESSAVVGETLNNLGVPPLHDQILEQHRGGFALPDGVLIALGIADLIMIDGALVAEQSWNIDPASLQQLAQGDLAITVSRYFVEGISGGQRLSQEGFEVSSYLNLDSLAMLNLIQNNLDNRVIETFRTINIDVSKLGNISGLMGVDSSLLWQSSNDLIPH